MSTLRNGETLGNGQELVSSNGGYKLCNQADGNVVLYMKYGAGWKDIWASNTCGQGCAPYRLVMQGDNHLVQYDNTAGGGATWASGVYGKGCNGAYAIMQDDGNFVVYDGSKKALWCTRTEGPQHSPFWGTGHRL